MIETMDYDLKNCLEYNPQDGFNVDDIAEVLAVYEGENDGDNWRWILRLNDARIVFLDGGCDYTGWDCRSWATSEFTETAEIAAGKEENEAVRASLLQQLSEGKNATWREQKDAEFGVDSLTDVIN